MFKGYICGLCAGVIRGYQHYVSPYKGFMCAHRALQGGMSCSAYALEQFQTKKLWEAYTAMRARMRECGVLYREHLSKQPIEVQLAIAQRKRKRRLRLIDPRTYLGILKRYLIRNWPKRNLQGGVQ